MREKCVFDDNEKQSFENSLVWTGPKTDKKQTKENKNDLFSSGSYFHQMNSITVANKSPFVLLFWEPSRPVFVCLFVVLLFFWLCCVTAVTPFIERSEGWSLRSGRDYERSNSGYAIKPKKQ